MILDSDCLWCFFFKGSFQDAVQPFGSSADGFRKPHVELINKTSVKVEARKEKSPKGHF